MSLSGLQDSWGSGGGSSPSGGSVPMGAIYANVDGTSQYIISSSAAGLVRWDISALQKNLGATTIVNPDGSQTTKYTGVVMAQYAFRQGQGSSPPKTPSLTGSYSLSIGVLASAPTSGDTDLLISAESVSAVNSPDTTSVYIYTVTGAIETSDPQNLYVYLAWQGLNAGTNTQIQVQPISIYVIPTSPFGFVPTPLAPATVIA